jgi:hypothetical protein
MALKPFWMGTGLLMLGAALGLALTNPSQSDYETFALEEARSYLKNQACSEELPLVGKSLEDECRRFLDSDAAQPQLRAIIANGTDRQNFFLFSLYRTELSLSEVFPMIPSGLVPSYEVRSMGVLRSLHLYKAEAL